MLCFVQTATEMHSTERHSCHPAMAAAARGKYPTRYPSADAGGVVPGHGSSYEYFQQICKSVKRVEDSLGRLRAMHGVQGELHAFDDDRAEPAALLEDVGGGGDGDGDGDGGEIILDAEQDEIEVIKSLMVG